MKKMKNLKLIYAVFTLCGVGFLFGQYLAKGTVDSTTGLIVILFILPAVLGLKYQRNSSN
jgi:hypothetical protein